MVAGWGKEVVEYHMKVHLFGAGSSPGCANFGLKRAANDGEEEFGADAAAFIRKDFYVDDGLKSVSTVPEAIQLIKASQAICDKAGLRLHKIVTNKKEVLEAIPVEDHAKGIKELNLAVDPLPIERALGVLSRTKIYSQTQQESSPILARKPFSRREWNGTKRDTKFVSLCNENETFVLLLSEREFG